IFHKNNLRFHSKRNLFLYSLGKAYFCTVHLPFDLDLTLGRTDGLQKQAPQTDCPERGKLVQHIILGKERMQIRAEKSSDAQVGRPLPLPLERWMVLQPPRMDLSQQEICYVISWKVLSHRNEPETISSRGTSKRRIHPLRPTPS
ncbi:hypothetical protein CDAR_595261, partial [Caerostris darwini]